MRMRPQRLPVLEDTLSIDVFEISDDSDGDYADSQVSVVGDEAALLGRRGATVLLGVPREEESTGPNLCNSSQFGTHGFNEDQGQETETFVMLDSLTELREEEMACSSLCFRFIAFKGGNYNIIYTIGSDGDVHMWIYDCGFSDGTTYAPDPRSIDPFESEYLKLLYKHLAPDYSHSVIIECIIISHGRFDHWNSLLLILCDLPIKTVNAIILGGNINEYVSGNKRYYLELVFGKLYLLNANVQIFSSAFKKHILKYKTKLAAQLAKNNKLDQEENWQRIGSCILNHFQSLFSVSVNTSSLLYNAIQMDFIPMCIYHDGSYYKYDFNTKESWRHNNQGPNPRLVNGIEYLRFLRYAYEESEVTLDFPVLNPGFSDHEQQGPIITHKDENYLCLPLLVQLHHVPAVVGNERVITTKVLLLSDSPKEVTDFITIENLDMLSAAHHASSKFTYDISSLAEGAQPKSFITTHSERLYTPRRGFLTKILSYFSSIKPAAPHPLFYHIYDSTQEAYADENTNLTGYADFGYTQPTLQVGVKKAVPVLYRKKQNCTKALFTISDFFAFNVKKSVEGIPSYTIYQPDTATNPTKNELKNAVTNKRPLNVKVVA